MLQPDSVCWLWDYELYLIEEADELADLFRWYSHVFVDVVTWSCHRCSSHDHAWPSGHSPFLQGLRMVSTWAIGGRTIKTCAFPVRWGCSFRAFVQYTSWISFHGNLILSVRFNSGEASPPYCSIWQGIIESLSHWNVSPPPLLAQDPCERILSQSSGGRRWKAQPWWLVRAALGSWVVLGGFAKWGTTISLP